jgi:hypothetical protein
LVRAVLVIIAGQFVSPLVEWIFGLHPITNQNHPKLFYFVGLPLGLIFLAIGIAYFVSRLNDGLDQEARQRRAQRSLSSLP